MLVEMNADEKALWDEIRAYWEGDFDRIRGHSDKWKADGIGRKQRTLTRSLMDRKAIPAHRFEWLKNPEFVVGSKKSRLEIFCENFGASDDRIFEHPHWYSMGYLPFLVGMIRLPDRVVEEFRREAEHRTMNGGYEMGMKFRAMAKSLGLGKGSADEFHKLALDCGYQADDCRTIRDIIFRHLR